MIYHDYKTITTTLSWCSPVAEQIPSQRTDTANLSVPSLDPLANYHDSTSTNWCHQILFWLVVSTPPKNISQWEGFSQILWKIKECSKPPTSFCGSQSKCFWLLPGLKSQTCPGPGAASWAGAWSIHTSPVKPSHNLGGYKTMIKHFFVGFYKLISFRYFYPLVI